MFSAKFLKHLLPRYSQGYFLVVPLIQDLVLQVDVDGKSISFESYNQSNACFYRLQQVRFLDIKFDCAEFFGVSHDRLITILYNKLQELYKNTSGFIPYQICYALNYGRLGQPLTNFLDYGGLF